MYARYTVNPYNIAAFTYSDGHSNPYLAVMKLI